MRPARASALTLTLLAAGCGGGTSATEPTPPATAPPAPEAGCDPVAGQPQLALAVVATGLSRPLDFQAAPGDRSRSFVVEQPGRIRVIRGGMLLSTPFLDLSSRLSSSGERGLLALAFHPGYASNGRFFVNYTDPAGSTRVSEFRVTADPEVADAGSERVLLSVAQPFSNHNGGALVFGLDGFLYVAMGDGGSAGDPLGNGQNLSTLLGSILRLDVDAAAPYAVPASNPFVGVAGARPEIWAYGLRNPWRIAFDGATGDLYIGDVGQGGVEEIDVGFAARGGGENYGWNVMEGSRCFLPASGCSSAGLIPPVVEYTHTDGCSVTGGVVYQGCRMPGHHGTYFYGDFCSGFVRSFRLVGEVPAEPRDWTSMLGDVGSISGFGVDADGEIHILDHAGRVLKIVPAGT